MYNNEVEVLLRDATTDELVAEVGSLGDQMSPLVTSFLTDVQSQEV